MKSIKILIIEDEVLIAEHMKYYLTGFGFSEIFLAHSKKTALELLAITKPDIVLLDLHLQEPKDGIDIARVIDEKGGPPYIFITANVDMLILQEATHTQASSYITKPVKKADLFAAIQIALHAKEKPETSFLLIKENNINLKLSYSDILYIEGNSNYINIVTKKQKAVARKSMEWAELQLPENLFMRIHRSYIVNLVEVQRTNAKSVFIGDIEIPISRANVSKMFDFLKKKENP
ncbi:MAG: DNA-binding response regulator [Bacteroidota bacterium]|nr:DNA-binding response regulator [Bacteroidota bacterium]